MPTDLEMNYGNRYRALKRWPKDFLAGYLFNECDVIYPTYPGLLRLPKDDLISMILDYESRQQQQQSPRQGPFSLACAFRCHDECSDKSPDCNCECHDGPARKP